MENEDLPKDTRTKDECIDRVVCLLNQLKNFKVTNVEKDIPVDDEYTMSMIRYEEKRHKLLFFTKTKDIAKFTLWKGNIPVGTIQVLGGVIDKAIELNCYKEEILDVTISKLKYFAKKNENK